MDKTTSLLRHGIRTRPGTVSGLPSMPALMVAVLVCMTANAGEPVEMRTSKFLQTPASISGLQTEPAATGQQPLPPSKPLDLRVPDITKLFSTAELEQLLANTKDRDIDEVEVEGARAITLLPLDVPRAWPGLFAPFWALTHPTQAWRIFAPIPSDQ